MEVLGIDIGGSGIKGNLVDPVTGALASERRKILTPQPSTPDAVASVVVEMVEHFAYHGPVGITFPAIVRHGVTLSAANVDPAWVGTDADALFTERTGLPVTVLNDADAAGLAEMAHGAGRDREGVVLLLTFGTGIGSALFNDRRLVPNTELGHLHFRGLESVEQWAAASAREREGLSWKDWAERVNEYLRHLERVFSPDLFVIGGGISRKWDKWGDRLSVATEVTPARLQNEAGIVGAAMAAMSRSGLDELLEA
ncbi:MAG: ROK family protein [Acidimicrobiia bacterium]|jgi:polyphosphate glucokinase